MMGVWRREGDVFSSYLGLHQRTIFPLRLFFFHLCMREVEKYIYGGNAL